MRFLLVPMFLLGCGGPDSPAALFPASHLGDGQIEQYCADWPGDCAKRARVQCPDGYDVVSTAGSAYYGTQKWIIRCAGE